MLSKRIKNIIKKVMVSLVLVCTLTTGLFTINTYARSGINPFQVSQSSITYQQKESKGKILLYNSHEIEEYADGYSIVEASYNLKEKLEKLGYDVTVLEGDFSKNDYNNAYFNSRKALKELNIDEYTLILDIHRNAIEGTDTTTIDGKEFVRIMPVLDQSSPNYNEAKDITDGLMDGLRTFGNIDKDTYEFDYTYNTYFNQDLGNNILLEIGNQNNTKWEVQRSLTYLSKSIDTYIKNNLTNN